MEDHTVSTTRQSESPNESSSQEVKDATPDSKKSNPGHESKDDKTSSDSEHELSNSKTSDSEHESKESDVNYHTSKESDSSCKAPQPVPPRRKSRSSAPQPPVKEQPEEQPKKFKESQELPKKSKESHEKSPKSNLVTKSLSFKETENEEEEKEKKEREGEEEREKTEEGKEEQTKVILRTKQKNEEDEQKFQNRASFMMKTKGKIFYKKKGPFSTWKLHYAIVDDCKLLMNFFKSQEEYENLARCKLSIDLRFVTIIKPQKPRILQSNFPFKMQRRAGLSTVKLAAFNEEERAKWITTIEGIMERVKMASVLDAIWEEKRSSTLPNLTNDSRRLSSDSETHTTSSAPDQEDLLIRPKKVSSAGFKLDSQQISSVKLKRVSSDKEESKTPKEEIVVDDNFDPKEKFGVQLRRVQTEKSPPRFEREQSPEYIEFKQKYNSLSLSRKSKSPKLPLNENSVCSHLVENISREEMIITNVVQPLKEPKEQRKRSPSPNIPISKVVEAVIKNKPTEMSEILQENSKSKLNVCHATSTEISYFESSELNVDTLGKKEENLAEHLDILPTQNGRMVSDSVTTPDSITGKSSHVIPNITIAEERPGHGSQSKPNKVETEVIPENTNEDMKKLANYIDGGSTLNDNIPREDKNITINDIEKITEEIRHYFDDESGKEKEKENDTVEIQKSTLDVDSYAKDIKTSIVVDYEENKAAHGETKRIDDSTFNKSLEPPIVVSCENTHQPVTIVCGGGSIINIVHVSKDEYEGTNDFITKPSVDEMKKDIKIQNINKNKSINDNIEELNGDGIKEEDITVRKGNALDKNGRPETHSRKGIMSQTQIDSIVFGDEKSMTESIVYDNDNELNVSKTNDESRCSFLSYQSQISTESDEPLPKFNFLGKSDRSSSGSITKEVMIGEDLKLKSSSEESVDQSGVVREKSLKCRNFLATEGLTEKETRSSLVMPEFTVVEENAEELLRENFKPDDNLQITRLLSLRLHEGESEDKKCKLELRESDMETIAPVTEKNDTGDKHFNIEKYITSTVENELIDNKTLKIIEDDLKSTFETIEDELNITLKNLEDLSLGKLEVENNQQNSEGKNLLSESLRASLESDKLDHFKNIDDQERENMTNESEEQTNKYEEISMTHHFGSEDVLLETEGEEEKLSKNSSKHSDENDKPTITISIQKQQLLKEIDYEETEDYFPSYGEIEYRGKEKGVLELRESKSSLRTSGIQGLKQFLQENEAEEYQHDSKSGISRLGHSPAIEKLRKELQ